MKKITQITIPTIFNTVLDYIINILILYIIIILILSLGKVLYTLSDIFSGDKIGTFLAHSITDILSFLVMIELFRSFVEYFKTKRIRLHSMIDPAIIFIIRELIIKLYSQDELINSTLIGFGILLLCLGMIRTLALLISPQDGS
jgi:uncharacterized membrane protein (DUF373 family)